jgi:hypothetical protein
MPNIVPHYSQRVIKLRGSSRQSIIAPTVTNMKEVISTAEDNGGLGTGANPNMRRSSSVFVRILQKKHQPQFESSHQYSDFERMKQEFKKKRIQSQTNDKDAVKFRKHAFIVHQKKQNP